MESTTKMQKTAFAVSSHLQPSWQCATSFRSANISQQCESTVSENGFSDDQSEVITGIEAQ